MSKHKEYTYFAKEEYGFWQYWMSKVREVLSMEEIKVLKDENQRLKESLKQEQCRTKALQKSYWAVKFP